ncbi:MAG TPA: hypothetical protein PK395_14110 [bacterium]|nr:hypothetical protein [bacterium]
MTAQRKVAYKTLLGIEFGEECIRAVLVSRNGHGAQMKKSLQVPLVLDPLVAAPELLGQEIRNRLQEAGIRETHCVICLPLKWVLKHRIELPDLPSEDQKSFIDLHAERQFPFPLEDLSISTSMFAAVDGKRYITIVAVPFTYIQAIETACRTAGLKPISITIGVPVSEAAFQGQSVLSIQKRESGMDFMVLANGGVATLRWVESEDNEGKDRDGEVDEAIFREMRLTLRELPSAIRESIRTIYIHGESPWRSRFQPVFQNQMGRLSLDATIERRPDEIARNCPALLPLYGTVSQILDRQNRLFEFLPPRVSSIQHIVSRISSRGNLLLGGIAAAMILSGIVAFSYQQIQLTRLQSQWKAIETQATEIEALQDKVRLFRSWYDDTMPSLNAMLTITEAFPEEGVVWSNTVEMKDSSNISCEGYARGNTELLTVLDRLNQDKRIEQLQVQQVQGKSPIQFGLSLYWSGK